jgi:hypothetical protein
MNDGERQNCQELFSWEDMSGYSIPASWVVSPPVLYSSVNNVEVLKAFLF